MRATRHRSTAAIGRLLWALRPRRRACWRLATAAWVFGLVGLGLSLAGVTVAHADPTKPIWMPIDDPLWRGRSFILRLHLGAAGAQSIRETGTVVPTAPRMSRGRPSWARVTVRDYAGNVLHDYDDWHPNARLVNDGAQEHLRMVEAGEAFLVVPYDSNAAEIEVRDQQSGEFILVDTLVDVAADYCTTQPEQPPCSADLAVRVATDDLAYAGVPFNYRVSVENVSTRPAHASTLHVTVKPLVPAAPAVASVSYPAASCLVTVADGSVQCDILLLAPGARIAFDFSALAPASGVFHVGAPYPVQVGASVEVTAGRDANAGDNVAGASLSVYARADLVMEELLFVEGPPRLVTGEPDLITLSALLNNRGPATPMLARVFVDHEPAGTAAARLERAGPSLQTLVTQESTTEVHLEPAVVCLTPGEQHLLVQARLTPASPHDSDPQGDNNTAAAVVTLQCAQHVRIAVKPGDALPVGEASAGEAAPINQRAAGVIPVAVFGDPSRDFDVMSIDWGSLRLGTRAALQPSARHQLATPRHAAPHFEDVDSDGNVDAVVHFESEQTRFADTETQACVVGAYDDAAGHSFELFGCAPIRVVGSTH